MPVDSNHLDLVPNSWLIVKSDSICLLLWSKLMFHKYQGPAVLSFVTYIYSMNSNDHRQLQMGISTNLTSYKNLEKSVWAWKVGICAKFHYHNLEKTMHAFILSNALQIPITKKEIELQYCIIFEKQKLNICSTSTYYNKA